MLACTGNRRLALALCFAMGLGWHPAAVSDPAPVPAAAGRAAAAPAETEDYARREAAGRDLERFEGGDAVVAVIVIVIFVVAVVYVIDYEAHHHHHHHPGCGHELTK